jgi:hypothetical protein
MSNGRCPNRVEPGDGRYLYCEGAWQHEGPRSFPDDPPMCHCGERHYGHHRNLEAT